VSGEIRCQFIRGEIRCQFIRKSGVSSSCLPEKMNLYRITPSRTLINRTRNMKFRDRNEIVASLIAIGELEREEVETATKKAYRYRSLR